MPGQSIPVGTIEAVARIRDQMSGQLLKIQRNVNRTGQRMRAAGDRMQNFGRQASVATALVAGGMTAVGVAFGQFESAMNRVEALTQASADQMGRMTEQAQQLGATTIFSAKEAAEGMGFLAAAGFQTNEIMRAMPGLLSVAAAGQLGLAEASDIASNVLSGFGLAVDNIGRVGDVLALTAASANTNIQMMGETMTYLAPAANLAGQSLEEMAAMAGQLGNAGIQASMAGTSLAQVIIGLQKPTDSQAALLERLNVAVFDNAGKMRSLNAIFRDLRDAGISNTDMLDLFNTRALKAAGILIQNVDATAEFVEQLEESEGAADRMAETMNRGLKGSFVAMKSAIEGLLIALGADTGGGLAGVMQGMITRFTTLVRWITTSVVPAFAALPSPIQAVVVGFGLMAAAVGPALLALGTATKALGALGVALTATKAGVAVLAGLKVAFTALLGPVGLVVAAAGVLTVAWAKSRRAAKELQGEIDGAAAVMEDMAAANLENSEAGRALAAAHDTVAAATERLNAARKAWGPGRIKEERDAEEALRVARANLATATDAAGTAMETAAADAAALAVEEAAAAMAAEDAARALEQEMAEAAAKARKEAAELAAKMTEMKDSLLGLPTAETRREFALLQEVWEGMDTAEQAAATERYRAELVRLGEAGAQLTVDQKLMVVEMGKTRVAFQGATLSADVLKQRVPELGREFKALPPTLREQNDALEGMKAVYGLLPAPMRQVGATMKGIWSSATEGTISKIAGLMSGSFSAALAVVKAGLLKGATAAKAMWAAVTGPVGMVVAAVGAVAGAIAALWRRSNKEEEEARRKREQAAAEARAAARAVDREAANAALRHIEYLRKQREEYERIKQTAESLAERLIDGSNHLMKSMMTLGSQVGVGTAEAINLYSKYVQAVKDGNDEVVSSIEAKVLAWRKTVDNAISAAVSAWDKARDEGQRAYDEAYAAAILAGQNAWQAAATARDAQLEAIAEVLKAEGQKLARQAAFEAALAEIRKGNAAGAITAAKRAAAQTLAAWEFATEAVAAADQAATEAMLENQEAVTQAAEDTGGVMRTEADASATAQGALTTAIEALTAAITAMANTATEAGAKVVSESDTMTTAISSVQSTASAAASSIKSIGEAAGSAKSETDKLSAAIKAIPSAQVSIQQNKVSARSGTGGIRDFGAGTPAVLHGREGVFTQTDIERMISAAASGGGPGGGGPVEVVVNLDGREIARGVMPEIRKAAQAQGYR